MNVSHWIKAALVAAALMGSVPGCSDSGTTSTVRATSREIRGKVPVRTGANRISKVVAIDAKTRRVIAQTVPAANGSFVLTGVAVGATYRIHAIVGRRSIPIVFPKARGVPAKTNIFKVGTKNSPRAGTIDGPIDVGDLSSTMEGGEEQFNTPAESAPNLQEDFDEDGMPDGADSDVDGDNVPNDMDMDNDGDGMPDNAEFGDQDGDGLTNESDPDMDGDGMPNAQDPDNDNDGTPDAMDTSPNGAATAPADDTDGDGIPNSEDSTDPDNNTDTGGSTEGDGGVEADAGAGVPPACTSCATMSCAMQVGACASDPVCAACLTNPTPACAENTLAAAVRTCTCMSCAAMCPSICPSM